MAEAASGITALGIYFCLNLFTAVSNKSVLANGFPYLLTAFHATASFTGTGILLRNRPFEHLRKLSRHDHSTLLSFSTLYTINIAISNHSLHLVSLPVHQIIRATAPAITIVLDSYILRHKSYSLQTRLSTIPIISGVVLAAYGDRYSATSFGLSLTLLGAVLAVVKTIVTHKLQTQNAGLKLPPLQLLHYLSPYAAIQALAIGLALGETSRFLDAFRLPEPATARLSFLSTILTNAASAFLLNVASFEANRRCGPLSMAVAANLKQVAVLGIAAYNAERFNWCEVVGTTVTVCGGIWYAWSRIRRQRKAVECAGQMTDIEEGKRG